MQLDRLLNPSTIAVFGGAQAEEAIRQSDLMGYEGEIWPVHPHKSEIRGRRVYRSVEDLPGSPDAAYIGVNRAITIDIVKALAAIDSGGAVCYATGFIEAGDEGSQLQAQLLAASGDMPLIGPNCYGLLNYRNGAMLWPDQQGGRRVDRGVAIITMSSNVGFNLTMQRRGLPITYLVSLGNRLKFDLHDAIYTFANMESVTALGLFLETIPDPKAFQDAIDFARQLGKPVVAMKIGRSDVAQKIVLSHTASLSGSDALVSALFERVGVARVHSLEALIEALKVLHVLGPLQGNRVAAMSTSGGDLTLLADGLGPGLTLPPLSSPTAEKLQAQIHELMVAANPFDFQMFNWNDEEELAKYYTTFLSDGFDIALCLLDYPRDDRCDQSTWLGAERGFVRAATSTGTKGAVLATFSDTIAEAVAMRLMEDGVAMLAGIDDGLAGVQAAVDIGSAWSRPLSPPLLPPVETGTDQLGVTLNEVESKTLLAQWGVPIPPARVVGNAEEAILAAADLGYPVVIKAIGVAHKTDLGGVKLDLSTAVEVATAIGELTSLSHAFLIEKMVTGVVVEIIVGVARDPQFGPYLLVGAGGILVELIKDSTPILLPATRAEVLRALEGLNCAPLFHGFRGAPPADLDAAAEVILAVAQRVIEDPVTILELDINPLLLRKSGQGAIVADALIRLTTQGENTSAQTTLVP